MIAVEGSLGVVALGYSLAVTDTLGVIAPGCGHAATGSSLAVMVRKDMPEATGYSLETVVDSLDNH
jgi:hypothetical protein